MGCVEGNSYECRLEICKLGQIEWETQKNKNLKEKEKVSGASEQTACQPAYLNMVCWCCYGICWQQKFYCYIQNIFAYFYAVIKKPVEVFFGLRGFLLL